MPFLEKGANQRQTNGGLRAGPHNSIASSALVPWLGVPFGVVETEALEVAFGNKKNLDTPVDSISRCSVLDGVLRNSWRAFSFAVSGVWLVQLRLYWGVLLTNWVASWYQVVLSAMTLLM